ncbi:hypothetical protein GGR57DRAFT_353706 [Xylariaceae sp. FL1272]|nr:hypothetical protein GGR57DRAFT_353706 [Xylariaceae sp. FL1272]
MFHLILQTFVLWKTSSEPWKQHWPTNEAIHLDCSAISRLCGMILMKHMDWGEHSSEFPISSRSNIRKAREITLVFPHFLFDDRCCSEVLSQSDAHVYPVQAERSRLKVSTRCLLC